MARKIGRKGRAKVRKVMREYKTGSLHSGRSGRRVRSRKQAVAIALSMGRRASRARPRRGK